MMHQHHRKQPVSSIYLVSGVTGLAPCGRDDATVFVKRSEIQRRAEKQVVVQPVT